MLGKKVSFIFVLMNLKVKMKEKLPSKTNAKTLTSNAHLRRSVFNFKGGIATVLAFCKIEYNFIGCKAN